MFIRIIINHFKDPKNKQQVEWKDMESYSVFRCLNEVIAG